MVRSLINTSAHSSTEHLRVAVRVSRVLVSTAVASVATAVRRALRPLRVSLLERDVHRHLAASDDCLVEVSDRPVARIHVCERDETESLVPARGVVHLYVRARYCPAALERLS